MKIIAGCKYCGIKYDISKLRDLSIFDLEFCCTCTKCINLENTLLPLLVFRNIKTFLFACFHSITVPCPDCRKLFQNLTVEEKLVFTLQDIEENMSCPKCARNNREKT